jgi:hypothetical protein
MRTKDGMSASVRALRGSQWRCAQSCFLAPFPLPPSAGKAWNATNEALDEDSAVVDDALSHVTLGVLSVSLSSDPIRASSPLRSHSIRHLNDERG